MSPVAGEFYPVPEGEASCGNEAVSDAAYRLEACPAFGGACRVLRCFKFLAQILHVDVEYVAPRKRIEIPDLVEKLLAGEDLARPAQETLEECVLLESQRHFFFPDVHPACGRVYREAPQLVYDGLCHDRSAQYRRDTRDELAARERLDDVVVRAAVEKLYFILCVAVARDDNDRRRYAFRAQTFGKRCPVHAGEREVENNHVVLVAVQEDAGAGLFGICEPVDTEARALQKLFEIPRKHFFVFDD